MARKNNADLTWNANKENARNPKFCLHSIFLSHKVSSINFISKMSSLQVNKFCIIQIDCNGEKFVEIAPTIWLEEEEKFVFWPPASKLKSFSKKGTVHPLPSWRRQTYQKILGKYGDYHRFSSIIIVMYLIINFSKNDLNCRYLETSLREGQDSGGHVKS